MNEGRCLNDDNVAVPERNPPHRASVLVLFIGPRLPRAADGVSEFGFGQTAERCPAAGDAFAGCIPCARNVIHLPFPKVSLRGGIDRRVTEHKWRTVNLTAPRGFIAVTKPELGTKRLCAHCGAKFYDLQHAPITCPKCSAVFEAVQVRPRGVADPVRGAVREVAPVMQETQEAQSLDASAEAPGKKKPN